MVESVDTQDLKSCGGNPVRVQVPLLVHNLSEKGGYFFALSQKFNYGGTCLPAGRSVDTQDLKSCGGNPVRVQVPLLVHNLSEKGGYFFALSQKFNYGGTCLPAGRSVDTQDLKSCGGNPVRVQVPLLVLNLSEKGGYFFCSVPKIQIGRKLPADVNIHMQRPA